MVHTCAARFDVTENLPAKYSQSRYGYGTADPPRGATTFCLGRAGVGRSEVESGNESNGWGYPCPPAVG